MAAQRDRLGMTQAGHMPAEEQAGHDAVYRHAMSQPDVARLIDDAIGREGGYANHPADRGGPTRWGVTEQVARAYGYTGAMRVYPRADAIRVYAQVYWARPGFNAVATRYPALAEELFDAGINMGPSTAAKMLQRALNALNSGGSHYADIARDGQIGPVTMLALDAFRQRRGAEGGEVLLEAVRSQRSVRYLELSESRPSQEAFTYGWLRRMVELGRKLLR